MFPEVFPSKREFVRFAETANLVPVYTELLVDLETPISLFYKAFTGHYGFLLESLEGGEKWARYSFIGLNPFLVFRSKGRQVTLLDRHGETTREVQDPLETLKEILSRFRPASLPELPRFFGGAVGFISYDMIRFIERLPDFSPDTAGFSDLHFMFPEILLVYDRLRHVLQVIYNARIEPGISLEALYERARAELAATVARVRGPLIYPPVVEGREEVELRPEIEKEQFKEMVRRAKDYIAAGDVIQVVLSQRFSGRSHLPPFAIYRALRKINPSPYLFFLRMADETLIGSSPEILVRVEDRQVETRPIAGTRPRGRTETEDVALAEDLLHDPKERAEHLMLVDLGRNDLGRVCTYGSVDVYELMVIERYSHVMHLVSGVRGELSPDKDMFDVFRAAFPAGTVSGAPKIRAMEIIEELEPTKRGPYAGAVGYFGFSGNMDLCITIRTLFQKGDQLYLQAGAGIVADSDPEREYEETLNKARGMMKALEMVKKGVV
ncbi:anthranilate synthase component I [Thermosulfurimonas dismutans]|uniref:Anthranilate synthase component 1 n=1 Tax=Thermosulfurimonas dismutans TaxID=999894 RepID=A0A179D690_9BACT|nr:anthranilate synthase component I [Thermosulfurimonas dismutans]OAQ20962.1 Anthranilate synthase, aminase component [Thermosulfurimonas dismutans]